MAEGSFLKKFRARVEMDYNPAERNLADVTVHLPIVPVSIGQDGPFWKSLKERVQEGANESVPIKGQAIFGPLLGKTLVIPPVPGYTEAPPCNPTESF